MSQQKQVNVKAVFTMIEEIVMDGKQATPRQAVGLMNALADALGLSEQPAEPAAPAGQPPQKPTKK